jgi:gluconate 2-dehydrogenase gamma chain
MSTPSDPADQFPEIDLAVLRKRISRRLFLAMSGSLVASCTANRLVSVDRPALLAPPDERLLADVQEHLLPSDPSSPGARDIGATRYIQAAVQGSDVPPEDAAILRHGLRALASMQNTHFAQLSPEAREDLLRRFEATEKGASWLTLVMGYTLEAYVGDPAYGGNPDGIVWRWLEHTPGFPRPAAISWERRR